MDYQLVNVTRDRAEVCAELDDWKEYECSDPENYVHDSFKGFETEYDEYKGYEKRIEKFDESLKQMKPNNKESFYFAVLFGTYFKLKRKEASFQDDLRAFFGTLFLQQLEDLRPGHFLDLNVQTLERQCEQIIDILLTKNFSGSMKKEKNFGMSSKISK